MTATKKFELQPWVETRVHGAIVPFIGEAQWEPWKVALFAAITKDRAFGSGKLTEAIANNPPAAVLALVKCARLGLSPNPAEEEFALVPRKGVICDEVMWRGWQALMLKSGGVEWIHADVIYKAEYDALIKRGCPLRDPLTNAINAPHVVDEIKRDEWQDKDIVASYCMVKLKSKDRLVSVVLTRKELDSRRAMAQTDKVWAAHYAKMCLKSAVKAVARTGQVPLSPAVAEALLEDDALDETTAAPVATPVLGATAIAPPAGAMVAEPSDPDFDVRPGLDAPPPPAAAKGAEDFLFDELNKDPLPAEGEHAEMLRSAIVGECVNRDISDDQLLQIVHGVVKDATVEGIDELDAGALAQVLDIVVKGEHAEEGDDGQS